MKIKFNSENDLLPNETLKLCNLIIVVRSISHEGNKYCAQVFLEEGMYKLAGKQWRQFLW